MRVASDFVSDSTSGSTTSLVIAAEPEVVWRVLHDLRFRDLRVSGALMGVRSLPARVLKRGSLRSGSERNLKVIESMASSRFIELHREPPAVLTFGIVGQFWKLSGGTDASVGDAASFVAFDETGFIKSAIDFVLEPTNDGTTKITTQTCNRATDAGAAKRFGAYWRVVGGGSKLIRLEMLRAVRRAAEADVSP